MRKTALTAVLVLMLSSTVMACDELIHLWQPLKEAASVSYLGKLAGGIFWNKIHRLIPQDCERLHIAINQCEFAELGYDMLHEISVNSTLLRNTDADPQNPALLPRLEIIVPEARSDMKMQVDMVCYFGITVRTSMFDSYLLRYCLLGKNKELLAIDEIPLKAGLEIDWVYTGNYLTGGLAVHRIAIFADGQVSNYTLWTKTDLDKIAAQQQKDETNL